jgi:hypothetical protein
MSNGINYYCLIETRRNPLQSVSESVKEVICGGARLSGNWIAFWHLQVVKSLLDHYRILDGGNDFHWTTTRLAGFDGRYPNRSKTCIYPT